MDVYLLDWLNLLLRWAHVITAIAWIGASFHFVELDNSLTVPEDSADRDKGIGGERWAVHGGGFYHQQKYPVSPAKLPERLHWSMWESYATWLTGFALFTVLYLFNAGTFLIDKSLFDWSPAAAIAGSLGFLVVFWVVYDGICRLFGQRRHGDIVVGVLVFLFVVFASWLACQLFAGRAAYLLVGAMLATTMSGNVFFVIIPGQRKVVASLRAGTPVDPLHGRRGKQRSFHNTFFTLPVLIAMLSNHFGFLYAASHNWLWLVLLMLAGALIRLSFVLRHNAKTQGRPVPWHYAVAGTLMLAGVIAAMAPSPKHDVPAAAVAASNTTTATAAAAAASTATAATAATTPAPGPALSEVQTVMNQRCAMCHNETLANKGVRLDSPEQTTRYAQQIYQQAVVLKLMPLNNATQITDDERALLKRWFEAGAR